MAGTATLAFQQIIDLSEFSLTNLSSQAVSHWLSQDRNPSQWSAFMHYYGATRTLLKAGGLHIEDHDLSLL